MHEDTGPVEASVVAEGELTYGPDVTGRPDGEVSTLRSGRPWKNVAVVAGAAALAAGAAVVTTLAATHKSAVQMNFKAYANGMNDALEAVRNGFDPFDNDNDNDDNDDDDY
ncbi:MAG: hypothetical protein HHJ14_01240 [Cellulomonas sp.]|uniref:hypothetical protein n=1 Tax=Cellulomonas sp. TaxID=40001 RepID=UPI0017B013A6|nr:hypothetical protein [Cellulomonas sp.]NMM15791.1 hypothetical protein [Cellulomonas sp.]NMM31952.1 hypothetical protein [Cellulomonas sp.]